MCKIVPNAFELEMLLYRQGLERNALLRWQQRSRLHFMLMIYFMLMDFFILFYNKLLINLLIIFI